VKRVGVVLFPGTNCEMETLRAFDVPGRFEAVEVWHDSFLPSNLDMIVLPGGWSYGDTLRGGTIARFAKVMTDVIEFAKAGGLVMGICNGFQVLTECGLLPGALARNSALRFRCELVQCRVEQSNSLFLKNLKPGTVYPLPIAHGEGRYVADEKTLEKMEAHGQIVLRYCNNRGISNDSSNPNGSMRNIAGVMNRAGNILGFMPHPERSLHPLSDTQSGAELLYSWAN
jgi:phosphoribosylformylglycinamidine synthase subunit PurQ / glutaminase